jgi:tRNA pseudouridine38-40 synthase
MPTYRLDLAYDGTRFHGYARQPGLRTIQGELEAALEPWTGGAETVVAGRTDRGVHATAQVVSFSCPPIDVDAVMRSLNRRLAPQIAVHGIRAVDDGFHARFSATGRAYRYRIHNAAVHDPFRASVAWSYAVPLDAERMHASVQCLVGEHDFAAFCRRRGDAPTTRLVHWSAWHRVEDTVEMSIGATSFCHQMVRSIVAVAVEIGRGRLAPGDLDSILRSLDRSTAKGAAPASGLTLVAVSYGDEELPRPGWLPETS